jgi:hypothetical protein
VCGIDLRIKIVEWIALSGSQWKIYVTASQAFSKGRFRRRSK